MILLYVFAFGWTCRGLETAHYKPPLDLGQDETRQAGWNSDGSSGPLAEAKDILYLWFVLSMSVSHLSLHSLLMLLANVSVQITAGLARFGCVFSGAFSLLGPFLEGILPYLVLLS